MPETVREDGVKIGNDFTADVQVRRAINLAIDRQEMIDHVLNGYGSPAYSVCDKMPWYNDEMENIPMMWRRRKRCWMRRDGRKMLTASAKRME